jgi:catechol 2,3-dioxygenase-like lactoylglutathione lyase family enzyme
LRRGGERESIARAMKVNHLHLMVPDVPAAVAFFEKYFELRKAGGNAGLTVLLDESGFVLTLMKLGSRSSRTYPENFHLGFFVADEARVDALNERMRADGFDVAPPRREHAYSFYVSAPGGFLVEVGA